MWGLDCEESWGLKNWCLELWCWRRLFRVLWTARRSNQSILKEISPGCSLEGLILKQKLQYFGRLMWRVDSLEETLMLERLGAGGERNNRGWDGWMASPIRWAWVWANPGSWWWTGRPGVLWFMGSQRVGHDWVTELNWTELSCPKFIGICPLEPFYVMLAVHSTLSQFICLRHMRFKVPPPSNPLWASLMAQQVKESPWDTRDTRNTGWIPGLGRSPGEGNGN